MPCKIRQQLLTVELLETRTLLAADITFAEPVTYPVSRAPADIIAGDVDGDGILDLLVSTWECCSTGVQVLLGNGDGTFAKRRSFGTKTSINSTFDVADFDSDGYLDVVSRRVLLNLGSTGDKWNGFSSPPPRRLFDARDVVATDLDGDGDADLVLARGSSVQVLLNNNLSDGEWLGFAEPITFDTGNDGATFGVSVADVNNDDDLDLVVSGVDFDIGGGEIGEVSVLLGNGDGTFKDPVELGRMGNNYPEVQLADLDGDQNVDIVVFTNFNNGRNSPVAVFYGIGDGTFGEPVELPFAEPSWGSFWVGDLDGDGDVDFITLRQNSEVHFQINDGSGGFLEQENAVDPQAKPQAMAVVDLDRDGDLDLAVATAFGGPGLACGRCGVDVFLNITEVPPMLPGDANRDGIFNSSDLVAVLAAGEYDDQIAGNSTFEEGDWNGDGDFDSGDLVLALAAGHYVSGATPAMAQRIFAMDTERQSNLVKYDDPFDSDNDEDDFWFLT